MLAQLEMTPMQPFDPYGLVLTTVTYSHPSDFFLLQELLHAASPRTFVKATATDCTPTRHPPAVADIASVSGVQLSHANVRMPVSGSSWMVHVEGVIVTLKVGLVIVPRRKLGGVIVSCGCADSH